MARKKTPKGGVPEPAQAAKKPKGFALPSIRGSDEWKAWVERLADADRASLPDLIDHALVAYAKKIKFNEPPPKR